MKNKSTKSADKAKLAKGAAEIKKAEKEAKGKSKAPVEKPEPVEIPESTRSINEIVAQRVKMLPGSIGLEIAADTPIEESLRILDWTTTLSNHVGFMIGDVLNFGSSKWGDKYKQAMEQTGRALSTLWGYAETSRRIPADKRVAALTFSHHREILRIGNDEKIATVLKEVGAQAEKGIGPTKQELRDKIKKLTPKKPKKVKAPGKGKPKKQKPAPPPYEPTAEEQARLDEVEEALQLAGEAIKAEGGIFKIAAKLDNKDKRRIVKLAEPVAVFYNTLDRITGYKD